MATLLFDGFDKYGKAGISLPPATTFLPQGKWSLSPFGTFTIVPGLSASGYALSIKGLADQVVYASRALSNNYARLIGGVRCTSNLLSLAGVTFFDNSTAQLTITIEKISGFLSIRSGQGGTLLDISTFSMASGTIHYIEYDITFNVNGTLGGWTVWLDGVQAMAGTGVTSLSANNYANVVQYVTYPLNFFDQPATIVIDDAYVFDDTTAFNNSALLSNPAIVTQFPISDDLTQFTNNGNIIGYPTVNNAIANGGDYGLAANTLYLIPVTPNVNCTINSIGIWVDTTNAVAQFAGVVYSDSAGAPNTLLSGGTIITGASAGGQLLLPLLAPQNLTANTPYWIGLINNTSTACQWQDGATLQGSKAANTFAGGAPSTAPAMTIDQATLAICGFCSNATTNWESEAQNPPIGDSSSVGAAVVNTEDLYFFPALPTNVATVYSVAISANCRLSFPGVHTFDLVALSNATQGFGSNTSINPTINYSWYDSYFDTDPHTSAAWTPTNASNAVYGMEIAS